MRKTIALLVSFFALTLGLSVPAHADVLYGLSSSSPGSLYTINTSTGAATHVVDLSGTTSTSFVDLAALNGKLYGSDIVLPFIGFTFGTINPTTGAYTPINNQGGSVDWQALASNPAANIFYTVNLDAVGDPLLSVTPGGAITNIGATNLQIRGLSFDTNHNILYGVDDFNLYTINTTTGAATLVGSTGLAESLEGIAYDAATNTLYLNTGLNDESLYTLNTTTGAATLVGPNGSVAGLGIDGIAFLPATSTPEPGTLTLIASGLVAFGGFHLRRWRRKPSTT
jgi:hypothetical protein